MPPSSRFHAFHSFTSVAIACSVFALCAGLSCGSLRAADAVLGPEAARTVPIADAHFHVNARTSSPEPMVQFKVRADSPVLKALLDLAGKYKRPLNIHAQWDPDTAQEVEQLAASNRGAQVMLSHCGSTADAVAIRGLLERNANVACDLSARGAPPLKGGADRFAVYDERGIRGGWKQLIEDYPDRFAVGLDIPQSWEEYEAMVRAIHLGLLANLSPATAEKVAYRNAQTWFGLE